MCLAQFIFLKSNIKCIKHVLHINSKKAKQLKTTFPCKYVFPIFLNILGSVSPTHSQTKKRVFQINVCATTRTIFHKNFPFNEIFFNKKLPTPPAFRVIKYEFITIWTEKQYNLYNFSQKFYDQMRQSRFPQLIEWILCCITSLFPLPGF